MALEEDLMSLDEREPIDFVQVCIENNHSIIFENCLMDKPIYHWQLLKKKLDEQNISYQGTEEDGRIQNSPKSKGKNYELVGAGGALLRKDKKHLRLSGESSGYKIGPNEEYLDQIKKELPEWKVEISKQ
tara:strand:+ start:10651 stop:11040 length:390 start_codon:yes stop_codon:yes gene_type:complete